MKAKSLLIGMSVLVGLLGSGAAVSAREATQVINSIKVSDAYFLIGKLVAEDPQAHINVRSGPGLEYALLGYGLVGDNVQVIGVKEASDKQIWFKVYFSESKIYGWIRADFVVATGAG
jgi:uncharacterized protein YgiM (DUF1202 family)